MPCLAKPLGRAEQVIAGTPVKLFLSKCSCCRFLRCAQLPGKVPDTPMISTVSAYYAHLVTSCRAI